MPLTWLTGKAHTGQRGIRVGPTFHLCAASGSMAVGVAVSAAALTAGPVWAVVLLLVGWAVTLHGMRNLRMMVFHQCAHGNMWRRPRLDRAVGHLVAALLLVQGFDDYRKEHVADHHAVHHMTVKDPTVQAFLLTLRLRPGMNRRQMWSRVLRLLVSPVYHGRFLVARLRSFWAGLSARGRVLVTAAYLALAAVLVLTDTWALFLVAWVVPLSVPFQVSNTLRLCVKHTFPRPDAGEARGRAYFASLTNAIFLGSPPPAGGRGGLSDAVAWLGWWARMLLVHFPGRYLVLTGDTVCHDFHHRHPMSKQWSDYIFARQKDLDQGHPGWPEYTAAWGLVPAINRVFDSLSIADPQVYDTAAIGAVSDRNLFTAFDD